jgi:hypothetical protein
VTALFGGELRRVLARRLVRALAGLAVLGVAVAAVLVFLNTAAVGDTELEARRAAAERAVVGCVRGEAVQLDGRLVKGPVVGDPGREEFCRFAVGGVDDPRFVYRNLKGVLQGVTAALVVVGWLIGASVIGADWQSRTLTTLLTWEPRRVRVLLVKALTCVVVAVGFGLLVQALLAGALLPAALWHGTTQGVDGAWGRSVAGVVGRGGLLVAIATVVGFSVAAVGRNSAAALGIGFAYFVVVENVVGNFLEGFRRWLILGNAIVLVSGENSGGEVPGRSVAVAALYLTAVALGILVLATVLFRRRDVA